MRRKNQSIYRFFVAAVACQIIFVGIVGLPAAAQYNYYYGHVHNHSTISDGSGSPEQAYNYAKNTAGLDFFGLADHANQITSSEWNILKNTANAHNEDGVFVAFWGFEWSSNDKYGHVAVINTIDYCTAFQSETDTFDELMTWLSNRDGVAFLNHPGREDTGYEFNHFNSATPFLEKLVGIELFNKTSGFPIYYYNDGYFSGDDGKGFYAEALERGWHIGAAGSGDNHDTDWGTRTDYRVAILSDELTRASIFNAFKARRFFSTLDKNLTLSFELNNKQMGSIVNPGSYECVIQAGDPDSETFTQVQLIKDGTVHHTWNISETAPTIVDSLTTTDGEYYYVKIVQADGDEAISSPVFVTSIDLSDAIRVLQILTGSSPSGIRKIADVDGNEAIGMQEAIYILQYLGSMR